MHVYDLADGNRPVTSLPHEQPLGLLAISPDGTLLVYCLFHTQGVPVVVKVWDLASGSDILSLKTRNPRVAFSPNGKELTIVDAGGFVQRFDVAMRRLAATRLPQERDPHRLAYTPDARTLAIGSADRSIRLYDPDTGEEQAKLLGIATP